MPLTFVPVELPGEPQPAAISAIMLTPGNRGEAQLASAQVHVSSFRKSMSVGGRAVPVMARRPPGPREQSLAVILGQGPGVCQD